MPTSSHTPAKILAELQSIQELLDERYFAPPFLPNLINPEAIPLLSDVIELGAQPSPVIPSEQAATQLNQEQLAQSTEKILHEVMAEFMPQIEARVKLRLQALLQEQLSSHKTPEQ